MIKHQKRGGEHFFVETRMGIVTRTGEWFHTTSEHLEDFAPGLLEKKPIGELIREAQAWVRCADSLALVLMMGLLFLINPWIAAVISMAFHGAWYFNKSGFVVRHVEKLFRLLNHDSFLYPLTLICLSLLGINGNYTAAIIGIVLFFVFKLGLLRQAWELINRKFVSHELSLNDRVLKMVIIKHAIYEDVAPAEARKMEERIKEIALKRKKGKG